MTKEQRVRIIVWSVFGFLGLIRLMYALIEGNTGGMIFGLLWFALGAGKAWVEVKKIDEQAGQPQLRKQPDRAPRAGRFRK